MKKCQICGKIGPTLCITQIVQGEVSELCLCEDCAKSKGLIDPMTLSFTEKFSPENLRTQIESLMKNIVAGAKDDIEEKLMLESLAKVNCPVCQFSLADWHKSGRLGCPDCYSSFAKELKEAMSFESLPRNDEDEEDGAVEPSSKLQLKLLQREMEEAIKDERYEEAAVLRDKIKDFQD